MSNIDGCQATAVLDFPLLAACWLRRIRRAGSGVPGCVPVTVYRSRIHVNFMTWKIHRYVSSILQQIVGAHALAWARRNIRTVRCTAVRRLFILFCARRCADLHELYRNYTPLFESYNSCRTVHLRGQNITLPIS